MGWAPDIWLTLDVEVKSTPVARKFVRDEIVKWRQVAIDAKMPREVN